MDTSNWTTEDHIEWMRYHGQATRLLGRVRLNQMVTTTVHYDIPWMRGFSVSKHLDPLSVQSDLLDLGPNPVIARHPESNNYPF